MVHSDDADVRESIVILARIAVLWSMRVLIRHFFPHVLDPFLDFLSDVMDCFCESFGWTDVWHQRLLVHITKVLIFMILLLLFILLNFILQHMLLSFKPALLLHKIILNLLYIFHNLCHILEIFL